MKCKLTEKRAYFLINDIHYFLTIKVEILFANDWSSMHMQIKYWNKKKIKF